MIAFGLVTEGLTDQIILKNILYGLFNTRDIPTPQLSPVVDETDMDRIVGYSNWITVLEYCQSKAFKFFLETTNNYVIIQIDTDALKGDSVPEKYRLNLQQANLEETIEIVKNKLIELMTPPFYTRFQDKIIFAISVEAIECWLLPFYFPFQKIKAAKTENCIATLNEGLQKAGYKFYIKAKAPDYYREISSPLKKNKELLKSYELNPSLRIFVDDLQNRQIDINGNENTEGVLPLLNN